MNDDRVHMTENPYQSPAADAFQTDAPGGNLRGDRMPLIIAASCGLALAVASNMMFASQEVFAFCVGVIGAILVFDLLVCVLMISQWRRERDEAVVASIDASGQAGGIFREFVYWAVAGRLTACSRNHSFHCEPSFS